jgi:hypothetical protein
MQLTRNLQDKRLPIECSDGEVAKISVLVVGECGEQEGCCGLVYDTIATNHQIAGEKDPQAGPNPKASQILRLSETEYHGAV